MTAYFALCLLVSSSLLMLVQPMVARMLLPHVGGAPGAWNTCMTFFQAGLLAGYAYAHFGPRWLGVRRHAIVHGVLMIAALALLPIDLPSPSSPPSLPALWILKTLALGVAIPYVLVASTSTLMQIWFARCTRHDPYFLYAASNLGSFLGLLAYPWLVEPAFTLSAQADVWRYGYGGLVGLLLVAIGITWGRLSSLLNPQRLESHTEAPKEWQAGKPAPRSQIVRWVLLALAPSSLMLSVTTHLTTDLASVPLLWIVPLGVYLLTFVVVFSRRPIVPHRVVVRYLPFAILFLIFFWFSEATSPLVVIMGAQLLGFAWLALFCHGELAASRPAVDRLSAFYFWIALGGVLGGAFNSLLAPLFFRAYLEYPLAIVLVGGLRRPEGANRQSDWLFAAAIGAACWSFVYFGHRFDVDARLASLFDVPPESPLLVAVAVPLLATLFLPRAAPYALALALILSTAAIYPTVQGEILDQRRSFFGVHRVARQDGLVKLIHGNTIHGIQSPKSPGEPLAYYHRGSPIGWVIERMKLKSVGVVGLGSGALAAYGEKGQTWTFFEIDPDVERLADRHFTYLKNCRADVRVVLGDARLTLARSSEKFDLLVIDAFGSDSIPTHLLTHEAMDLYAAHLNPGGIVAFHVSNRHLDLFPVLAGMTEFGWFGAQSDPAAWPGMPDDAKAGRLGSWWAVMSPDEEAIAAVCRKSSRWTRLTPMPGFRPWSDDFVNLGAVVRWRELLSDE